MEKLLMVNPLNPTVVVIVAPQGSGKTCQAQALAELLGCTCVVDCWDGISSVPPGALVLTNAVPKGIKVCK